MTVLVVEDDRKIANLLERGLSKNGHRVTVAADGREGTKMMLNGRYDAALLDVLLPGMNGLAVLESVRSSWIDRGHGPGSESEPIFSKERTNSLTTASYVVSTIQVTLMQAAKSLMPYSDTCLPHLASNATWRLARRCVRS